MTLSVVFGLFIGNVVVCCAIILLLNLGDTSKWFVEKGIALGAVACALLYLMFSDYLGDKQNAEKFFISYPNRFWISMLIVPALWISYWWGIFQLLFLLDTSKLPWNRDKNVIPMWKR